MDNIYEVAKELMKCYEKAYEIHKLEVDYIINNQITDINYIEHTLDYCLDIYTDKGFNLFLKLLLYYKKVNLENAYIYLEILKDIRKEEYDDFKKKLIKKYKKPK